MERRRVSFVLLLVIKVAACVDVPKIKMSDGRLMPSIALGTYLGFDGNGVVKSKDKELRNLVVKAIDLGWRHIDTAAIYNTEEEVGEGVNMKINEGTIKREDIFITTKLWNTHHKRDQVIEALQVSLKKLGLSYVDLYLMHWPISVNADNTNSDIDYIETWLGMEDAVKMGLAKSIGVSNFNKAQLERLLEHCTIKPVALQIEVHPQIIQKELVEYAKSKDIVVMGYSPFGPLVRRYGMSFPGPKVTDMELVTIAEKYGKTVPQLFLRWLVDRGVVPLPKTLNPKRLEENIHVFDFTLTPEEIQQISSYNSNTRFTLPSFWQENTYYPFEKIPNPLPLPNLMV